MLIYDELTKVKGRLTRFAEYLVEEGLFTHPKRAMGFLRSSKVEDEKINSLYQAWNPGKIKVLQMERHSDRLQTVFQDIKHRKVKEELKTGVEALESILMEITLAIKKQDYSKLPEVKIKLEEVLYGPKTAG